MPHRFPRSRSGFALIITVVLVAFLVLILVGLATFTRVETQVADNTAEIAKARQNATNALNLALGQLQRHAGPDERVTARSELVGGITAQNQAYFTGVWDTTAPITATPTAWLVSGNEGTASSINIGGIANPTLAVTQPYDDAAGSVFVVYNTSVGSANPAELGRRVRLNKQAITAPAASLPGFASTDSSTPTIGNYAYWVGDEGVKASLSVLTPNLSTLNYNNAGLGGDNWANTTASGTAELGSSLRDRLAQFGQPYRRIDAFYPGMDYTVGSTVSALGDVVSVEQVRFVANSVASAATQLINYNDLYHEMTPLARGVLARTDAGSSATTPRLRTDWSAKIVTPGVGTSGINDYWALRPASVSAAAGTFAAKYDVAGRKGSTGSGLSFSVAPLLSEGGLFVDFGVSSGGNLVLRTALLAEFWNPYAATIGTSSSATLRVQVKNGSSALVFKATDSTATPGPVPHTITIPANAIIAEAEVPAGQNFSPGKILQMQTTSAGVFATSGAGAKVSAFDSGVAATLPITTCDLPAVPVDGLVIELQENTSGGWLVLQTYSLLARSAETGVSPGTPYAAGYGFELKRNLLLWSDSGTANSTDPRSATFTAANHFEALSSTSSSHWDVKASGATNPSGVAGEAPLANNASIVLFDLPRQEITSVAQLSHLIGNRPYEIMRGDGASNAGDKEIFDATFVSTVPRNYTSWDFATEARPNRYLDVYIPEQAPVAEFGSAASRRASLRDKDNSARYQLIRGAFNINSTSAAAWSAVLGSSLSSWDTQDDAGANVNRAFFRAPHGAQEKGLANLVITDITADTPAAPAGADLADASALAAVGRRLTSGEITTLAQKIVAGIVANGKPFASLGEFVGSTVLTNAIAAAALNADIATPEYRHSAGAITPGDIIAAIAPFMSARSDTFKIRAYGDSVNPVTGAVVGRAWCEAIVQRVPDLANDPAALVADVILAKPSANPFGRKFKIVSFRWLTSDDI